MAGSTPIYGFPYPEPSDLVANYPALGQELAEDIEAVLPTLGGMTLIDVETFTTQSAISVNNCFTATYDNYLLLMAVVGSTSSSINIRMRVGGVDATTNYRWQVLNAAGASVTAASVSAQTSYSGPDTGTDKSTVEMLLFDPAKASATNIHQRSIARTVPTYYQNVGQHTTATAYDGYTLAVASGTITGTARLYGYKNS